MGKISGLFDLDQEIYRLCVSGLWTRALECQASCVLCR